MSDFVGARNASCIPSSHDRAFTRAQFAGTPTASTHLSVCDTLCRPCRRSDAAVLQAHVLTTECWPSRTAADCWLVSASDPCNYAVRDSLTTEAVNLSTRAIVEACSR